MNKATLFVALFFPVLTFAQPQKTFTEKLDGISTSQKELTKNASTDNSSIGQGGAMTNTVPLVTVSSRTMSFPLQLNYTAGIKTNQQSGPVGLGWVMPIGSIRRDFGSFYPDYSSTSHEADMYNVLDEGQSSQSSKGKFNTRIGTPPQAIQGTYLDPAVQQKYLGFNTIAADETRVMPLSDMYHVSVPGKLSNSFFNSGVINGDHLWKLTEAENWKVAHEVKTYKVSQEFSRINEANLSRDQNNNLLTETSYAAAIAVLPYVKNGFSKIPTGFSNVPNQYESYVLYEDFEKFTIIDENGTVYVFGRALRGQRYVYSDDPFWSNKENQSTTNLTVGSFWKIDYIAEWLLTEIHSVDYKDSNGNHLADDGDAGDWIRIYRPDKRRI
ncbi:SpvB/TcaC N-terminal domain-containing protein [Fluviicola taffensis]|uniref:Uncharacterized protein n=1 Tax=Fluviicola taffensis (strain DSM 16823 / NCIMB 13979 / RW262) TaxID=755732 RepID=F2IHF7_FLUTR|nr:SpvB/TcaC N-terminal domain-containing protein [Fluviicola taffensis]AEA43722.1 hypothetical protein Fluta_1730 [Fluviicola taffensis DSM 16823]